MRRILMIGVGVVLASCAATGPVWVKPGATEGEAADARAACQRREDRRMRDAGHYRYYEGDGSFGSDPMANVETENLRRQLEQAVATCMTTKGFKQAPRTQK